MPSNSSGRSRLHQRSFSVDFITVHFNKLWLGCGLGSRCARVLIHVCVGELSPCTSVRSVPPVYLDLPLLKKYACLLDRVSPLWRFWVARCRLSWHFEEDWRREGDEFRKRKWKISKANGCWEYPLCPVFTHPLLHSLCFMSDQATR